mmetsp:Transcript_26631/g.37513  ORF Transcript_26631/g.37513 Transcript_26631/m.37513 type:complete len:536 (-) Transcript_26631:112-1719(-)
MFFGVGNTTKTPKLIENHQNQSLKSVPSIKKAPAQKNTDTKRRVIFPSLHVRLSSIQESREDGTGAENDLSLSLPHQQLRRPLTRELSSAKDDFDVKNTRNLHGYREHTPSDPSSVLGSERQPLNAKADTASKSATMDPKSLSIPDVNGRLPTLFQQDHSEIAAIVIPKQSLNPIKKTTALPLPSILRSKHPKVPLKIQVSDSLPSLVSAGTKDEEDDENESEADETGCDIQNSQFGDDDTNIQTKSPSSSDCGKSVSFDVPSSTKESKTRSVSFDPRIWVCEFTRSKEEADNIWFSIDELENFKRQVVKTIYENSPYELVATGTGRVVRRPIQTKAIYANPALSLDATSDDEDDGYGAILNIRKVLKLEIRNILVVDPYDICCRLFEKAIHNIIPHAHVASARSGKEAMKKMTETKHGYDLIIIEERLTIFHRHYTSKAGLPDKNQALLSGSNLLKILSGSNKNRLLLSDTSSKPLLIGVSSQLDEDEDKLRRSGADFVWPKPPPAMNAELRNLILKALLIKRGKDQIASKLKW